MVVIEVEAGLNTWDSYRGSPLALPPNLTLWVILNKHGIKVDTCFTLWNSSNHIQYKGHQRLLQMIFFFSSSPPSSSLSSSSFSLSLFLLYFFTSFSFIFLCKFFSISGCFMYENAGTVVNVCYVYCFIYFRVFCLFWLLKRT